MKSKRNIIVYIVIIVLLVIVLVGSYAYFSTNNSVNNNNVIVSANLPSGTYVLEMTNPDDLSYTFTAEKMLSTNISTDPIATDNTTFNVSLATQGNGSIICEYDLVWEWNSTNIYTTSHGDLPITENGNTFNYEISALANSTTIGGPEFDYSNELLETDLSGFVWNNKKAIIVSDAMIVSDSTTPTVTTWTIESNLYNIPANQVEMAGKSFTGKIKMENVECYSEKETLYAMIESNADKTTEINFGVPSSVSITNGIYTTSSTDSGNPVYYYRGQVENNVIFANYCWKILHTTDTHGVKLIYSGVPDNNGRCIVSSSVGTSPFNNSYDDNVYVGYMYGTAGTNTYDLSQTNVNSSTIKNYVDTWYANNMLDYSKDIEDTVYCDDRNLVMNGANNSMGSYYNNPFGFGITRTLYGTVRRSSMVTINPSPSLVCENTYGDDILNYDIQEDRDSFTVSGNVGNGKLTYPVGLITTDELVFAGFSTTGNNTTVSSDVNYLSFGDEYWTMSSAIFTVDGKAGVSLLSTDHINYDYVNNIHNVRPVISLNKNVVLASGSGTALDPFVVE